MEQQRDYLLSAILSLDSLARANKLSNETVAEVTKHTLARISPQPGDQTFEDDRTLRGPNMIFDETKPETIVKLLRAIANGGDAKQHRHDVIFDEAADLIESLLAVIEDQEGTIACLKGATT